MALRVQPKRARGRLPYHEVHGVGRAPHIHRLGQPFDFMEIDGRSIPRFERVRRNLADLRLAGERDRVLFPRKFLKPAQSRYTQYLANNTGEMRDQAAVIAPPNRVFAYGPDTLRKTITSVSYFDGGPFCLGVVGPLGPRVNANMLAKLVAEVSATERDTVIISGNAEGVDHSAHFGSLNASVERLMMMPTIGVLPHGVRDKEYFVDGSLFRWLFPESGGGFVSIYDETVRAKRGWLHIHNPSEPLRFIRQNDAFLQRDGITTLFTDALLIIEASWWSGTEDTGRRAYLQGIPVFVIDWRMIDIPLTRGLPDVINEGIKTLVNLGLATSFPPRSLKGKMRLEEVAYELPGFMFETLLQLEQAGLPRIGTPRDLPLKSRIGRVYRTARAEATERLEWMYG